MRCRAVAVFLPQICVCVCVFMDVLLLLEAHSGSEPGLHRALLQNGCQNQRVSPLSSCAGGKGWGWSSLCLCLNSRCGPDADVPLLWSSPLQPDSLPRHPRQHLQHHHRTGSVCYRRPDEGAEGSGGLGLGAGV